MALFTALTKSPPVCIVGAMAAKAGRWRRHLGHVLDRVTGVTCETRVLAGQRKLGLLVVIEAPQLPTVGVMAELAGATDASLVESILVAG